MGRFKQLLAVWKEKGIKHVIVRVVFPSKWPLPAVGNYTVIRKLFAGKSGIEIGGPSEYMFEKKNNYMPLYNIIESLDNCNFSSSTIWEGAISRGQTFKYGENKTGLQYIAEATEVASVVRKDYDFLLSSNCLEHVANPMKALKEWLSILKPDGLLLLILPNKNYCFDHNRSITDFSHLLEDYKNNTGEDDLTHLDEILKLHDLSMDLPAGAPEQFKARSLNNFENRALHHHVFDMALLTQIFNYLDLDILYTNQDFMYTIVGQKRTTKSPFQGLWRKIYCGWYKAVGLY